MLYMSLSKKKILMNTFSKSQFSYSALIWMSRNCIMNNKFNRLNKRCLRRLYWNITSSFEKLLEQDKSVTINTMNMPMLTTETFKEYRNISPPILSEIFFINMT